MEKPQEGFQGTLRGCSPGGADPRLRRAAEKRMLGLHTVLLDGTDVVSFNENL